MRLMRLRECVNNSVNPLTEADFHNLAGIQAAVEAHAAHFRPEQKSAERTEGSWCFLLEKRLKKEGEKSSSFSMSFFFFTGTSKICFFGFGS